MKREGKQQEMKECPMEQTEDLTLEEAFVQIEDVIASLETEEITLEQS